MKQDEEAHLLKYAEDAFAFLETAGASLQTFSAPHWTTLAYCLPELTVEVNLDWREELAEVLVRKPGPDCPAEGYYVCRGQVIRHHLCEALALVGVSAAIGLCEGRDHPKTPQGAETIRLRLETDAGLLSSSVDRLIAGSEALFPATDAGDEFD